VQEYRAAPSGLLLCKAEPVDDMVEIGEYPRLVAQILRRRMESAEIPVLMRWTDAPVAHAVLCVPAGHAEFAAALVNEIDAEDEVPDTSPAAYIARIDEHLRVVAALLEELQTRLDER
jgi:AcrR family transcriptional regulator